MCRKPDKGASSADGYGTGKTNPDSHRPAPRRPSGQRGRANYLGSDTDADCDFDNDSDPVPPVDRNVDDPDALFMIRTVESPSDSAITVEPMVAGVPLKMEVDTGATMSIVSQETFERKFVGMKLEKSDVLLKTYTGERLQVLGKLQAVVTYQQQQQSLPFLVVAGQGPSLLGRNWLSAIRLNWAELKCVRTGLTALLEKHREIFREELGTLKGIEARLVLREGAVPKFHKPRPVPYAIRGAIERDLERLETLGVLEKVAFSDWAAPIVPVPKADGTIRICGDYKVTINPVLEVNQYPIPKADDLFATLAGGKKFSKIDLSPDVIVQQQLASTDVLAHYNPDLPLRLDCDASAYGVGAVLSHVFPNGEEKPIAYASRTLSQSEKGYAQLEKEALSLVFGIKKFHHFLYGRMFTLVTDHQPLKTTGSEERFADVSSCETATLSVVASELPVRNPVSIHEGAFECRWFISFASA